MRIERTRLGLALAFRLSAWSLMANPQQKALGLTIPLTLLARADEIIE